MCISEIHDRLRVGSIFDAKYALAARNTSLTRRSSAFSFASRLFSSTIAVVGRSSRSPRSASSWRIQFRKASGCTFSWRVNWAITGLGSDSRYSRTARSRSSSGYFLFGTCQGR